MFGLLKNLLRSVVVSVLEEEYPQLVFPDEHVLQVKRLYEDVKLPHKGSEKAAGYDLCAYIKSEEDVIVIEPHSRALVKTGLAVAVPEGCYGRIAPRSGLSYKKSIDVGAGVVDEDYRGELGVILINNSDQPFEIKKDDRIAQFVCEQIVYPELEEVEELDSTEREAGGFGSTGSN